MVGPNDLLDVLPPVQSDAWVGAKWAENAAARALGCMSRRTTRGGMGKVGFEGRDLHRGKWCWGGCEGEMAVKVRPMKSDLPQKQWMDAHHEGGHGRAKDGSAQYFPENV